MKLQPAVKTRSQKISAKIVCRLSFLAILFAANTAFAQQGDECLACHTGLPATAENVISVDTPSRTETPTTPATNPAVPADECNYDNAALFDGWGWNAATSQSCPPIESPATVQPSDSDCNFSRAAEFNGWGWNPVLRQSCPPEANVSSPSQASNAEPHSDFTICSATYFDSDGDGFGWENEASCIITSESAPPPVIINRTTGNQVTLKRAFWDGNTDIANKTIQCDLYGFDSYSGQYMKERAPYEYGPVPNIRVSPSHQFVHQPLEPTRPFEGWISQSFVVIDGSIKLAPLADTPIWTVDDGRYIGATMLQSPYYEAVFGNRGRKEIRVWHKRNDATALRLSNISSTLRSDGYYQCWDTSGYDFEPTGRPGRGTTSPVVKSDLVFSVAPNGSFQDPNTIVNLETGEPVEMVKAYWDYNKDLAGSIVSCEHYYWEPDPYGGGSYIDLAVPIEYRFPDHFTTTGSRLYFWQNVVGSVSQTHLDVTDGVLNRSDNDWFGLAEIFNSEYASLKSGVVEFWSSSEDFTSCNMNKPSGSAPIVPSNNSCDYRNAAMFDGWGWNAGTGQSCPPVTAPTPSVPATTTVANDCDYSNALLFDGWGWNPVTSQSCPPVEPPADIPAADDCDYRNALQNDGWGWNPVTSTSCRPK